MKNMKKTLTISLIGIMISSMVFGGCTKSPATQPGASAAPAKNTTLRVGWWGNTTRNERTQKVFDLYSKKFPNVTFEGEVVAWDGYWDKLATQTAANMLPDIIQQDYSYIGQYIDKKLLEDLNPYVKNGLLDTKDVNKDILASGTKNGGLFALSLGTNTQCILLDKAAFDKAGIKIPDFSWTWKDFEDTAGKLVTTVKLPSEPVFFSNPKMLLEYMARQQGKPLYKADGTALGFDDPKVIEDMLTRALNLTKSGVYVKPDSLVSVKATEDNPIVKGTAAIGSAWSNQYVAYSQAAKRELVLMSFPTDGGKPGQYLKPSMFFSVTSKSENKDEAVKFINYFTNDIDANAILLAERGVPISSKVRDGIKSKVDKDTQATFDFVGAAEKFTSPIDPPEPTGAGEIQTIVKTVYDEVVFQKTTPKDGAAKIFKQCNDVLAKNKK